MDRLSETHLRYLLTIYHLGQTVPDVSVIQIAQTLNVSKPSVTNMLNNLMDKGAIRKNISDGYRLSSGEKFRTSSGGVV